MVNYHPNDDLLMSFAAGQLSNSLGLMISCHLEHCAECRQKVHQYEAIGGALLETFDVAVESAPEQGNNPLLEKLLGKLDSDKDGDDIIVDVGKAMAKNPSMVDANSTVPRPLRRFLDTDIDGVEWKGMSKHIKEYELEINDPEFTAKFYKISAGRVLPEHTHEGNEYTLVLSGSFSDRTCKYEKGDFILADESTIHQPQATMDADCICFAVMDAPLKMTGFFGRMLNPFLR